MYRNEILPRTENKEGTVNMSQSVHMHVNIEI